MYVAQYTFLSKGGERFCSFDKNVCSATYIFFRCNKNVYTFLWLQKKMYIHFCCNHKNVYTFFLLFLGQKTTILGQQKCIYIFMVAEKMYIHFYKNVYTFFSQHKQIKMYIGRRIHFL